MRIFPLLLLLCAVGVTACSGPLFGARDSEGHHPGRTREATPPAAELLAMSVADVPTTADGAEMLRLLGVAIDQADGDTKRSLRNHRGELIADLLVASRVWAPVSLEQSEWYRAAAGLLVGVDAAAADFADAALDRVGRDLQHTPTRLATAEAELGAALGQSAIPRTASVRAVLLQLSALAETAAPWARYGDACDGGAFSRAAIAYRPTTVEAETLADGALATDRNVLTAQALLALTTLAADAAALDHPLVDATRPVIDELIALAESAAVPLDIPASLVLDDARLSPPRSFGPAPEVTSEGLGFTFRRTLLVRTDGVYAMVTPHVAVGDDGVPQCPAVAAGWGFPGRALVTFERFGAVPNDALVDGQMPAVREDLETMETFLAEQGFLPAEEARTDGREVGVSLIADGEIYFSTLRPLLETLRGAGYSPIALHTLHAPSGQLDAVAVRLVPMANPEDNLVIVREDGYVVQPYDPDAMTPPIAISRVTPNALLILHQTLVSGLADGTLNPERPLTVRVDDNAVDYAILAHLLAAVGFDRDLEGVTSDAELLRAPIRTDADSVPVVLAPAGVRLAL